MGVPTENAIAAERPLREEKPGAEINVLPGPSAGAVIQPTLDSDISEDDPEQRPSCFSNLLSECLFVLTTTFAIGQIAFLEGLLMTSSARIQDALNMNSSEVSWLVAGLSLTGGAFLIFFGRVADLFGRRMLLISSMASFAILMLISGFSQNAIIIEIVLAIAGVTCASVVPPAIGKLGAIYKKPSQRKNRAFACFSAGNPVGFVLGALIGGIVTEISSWRACFWVIATIYALLTLAAVFTTPADAEQSLGGLNLDTMKQMDWLGAFLCVASIALFTAAFTLASDAPHGWATSYVIALLVVGVVLMALFLYWQSVFKYPLMPLHVWRDRNFSLLVAALCLAYPGFFCNFFWIALGWQRAYLYSPLMVAVRLLPAALGGIMMNVIAAMLMHRVSNKLLFIIAASAHVGAAALLSATSKGISYWALSFPSLLLAVTGGDIGFCVTNLYVMSFMPPEQQSVAGGMFQTVTRLATTVGLGISTTVYASAGGTTELSRDAPWRPYQATFWVSLVGAFLGLALTPFLTVGKQGHRKESTAVALANVDESKEEEQVCSTGSLH